MLLMVVSIGTDKRVPVHFDALRPADLKENSLARGARGSFVAVRREDLVAKWEHKGAEFDAWAASVDVAAICQLFLTDLHALDADSDNDWISIPQATAFSGYSKQHIRRWIQSGQLAVTGDGKARRVRLQFLPGSLLQWQVRTLSCIREAIRWHFLR